MERKRESKTKRSQRFWRCNNKRYVLQLHGAKGICESRMRRKTFLIATSLSVHVRIVCCRCALCKERCWKAVFRDPKCCVLVSVFLCSLLFMCEPFKIMNIQNVCDCIFYHFHCVDAPSASNVLQQCPFIRNNVNKSLHCLDFLRLEQLRDHIALGKIQVWPNQTVLVWALLIRLKSQHLLLSICTRWGIQYSARILLLCV